MWSSKTPTYTDPGSATAVLATMAALERDLGRLTATVETLTARIDSIADEAEGARLTARNRETRVTQQIQTINNSLQRVGTDLQALRGVHGAKPTTR